MFNNELINKLNKIPTPFYFYNMDLLERTLQSVKKHADKHGFIVHYAMKANSNSKLLERINKYGLGADCVSGNEVVKAITTGFDRKHIAFAGVGKSDSEINLGLNNDIFSFNCESLEEIEVINELAREKGKTAHIALRINPNVNAHTHHYISTGLEENKFGINRWELEKVCLAIETMPNIKLIGIHFHIGSQITDMTVFKELCVRVNEFNEWFMQHNINLEHINVGGGLGIDYRNPEANNIPDFETFFNIFKEFLPLQPFQKLHFELGRAIIAQCGYLLTRVLYVKHGAVTNFAIVDAGMNDLIRPALYQAYHKIDNLTSTGVTEKYDVVGPICESSDTFGKAVTLPLTKRGDLIVLRSTGAYGEVMASQYNLRALAKAYYSDEL